MANIHTDFNRCSMAETYIYLEGAITTEQMEAISEYLFSDAMEDNDLFNPGLVVFHYGTCPYDPDGASFEHYPNYSTEETVFIDFGGMSGDELEPDDPKGGEYPASEYGIRIEVETKRALALVLVKLNELGIGWNLCDEDTCMNGTIWTGKGRNK